jgi:hypothetical protein
LQPFRSGKVRNRFADRGLDGLNNKPHPGKKPIYTEATNKRILALLDQPPPPGYARWSGPLLARALGDVDVQYVWRFLRAHKIDLCGRKSWCESNDPDFVSKVADIVGLYLAPPENAIVICVDAAREHGHDLGGWRCVGTRERPRHEAKCKTWRPQC